MAKRSLGVTVLALGTIMVALYSQYAALTLFVGVPLFAAGGELAAFTTSATTVAFVGLTATGYVTGVALWMRRPWSRVLAMGVYLTFFVANALLAILTGNIGTALLFAVCVAAAIGFLRRPQVRAELEGSRDVSLVPTTVADRIAAEHLEAPRPAH